MKKIIALILALVCAFTAVALSEQTIVGQLRLPANGNGIIGYDPDEAFPQKSQGSGNRVPTKWAKDGFVAKKAGAVRDVPDNQKSFAVVAVYTVIDGKTVQVDPESAQAVLDQVSAEVVRKWTSPAGITYVTTNLEAYDASKHTALVVIHLADGRVVTEFVREDGVKTLCLTGKAQPKKPATTKKPQPTSTPKPQPTHSSAPVPTKKPKATPAPATPKPAPVHTSAPVPTKKPKATPAPATPAPATPAPAATSRPTTTARPEATPAPAHSSAPVPTKKPGK